jgi:hypothetical protein
VAGLKILVTTVACDCCNVSAFKPECRRFAAFQSFAGKLSISDFAGKLNMRIAEVA